MKIAELKDTELAYLAGLLDGEGTICMKKQNLTNAAQKIRYRIAVTLVYTTSIELVGWLSSTLGSAVQIHNVNRKGMPDHYSQLYLVRMSEIPGEEMIKRLLPYLVIKRRQAELFLRYREIQKACHHEGAKIRWSQEKMKALRVLREWYRQEFHRLNARGPDSSTTNTPDLVFEAEARKIESELYSDVQRALAVTHRPRLLDFEGSDQIQ